MSTTALAWLVTNWRSVAWVLGIAIVVALLAAAAEELLSIGAQRETSKIERANDAAENKFRQGTEDVDRCYDSGGRWDRFARMCKHASPSE